MTIEILFLLLLAYLLLGPQKSARLAHKAGGLLAQFNKVKADVKARMTEELASVETNSGSRSDPPPSLLTAASIQPIHTKNCVDLLESISSTTPSITAVPLPCSPNEKEAIYERRVPDQIGRDECLPS